MRLSEESNESFGFYYPDRSVFIFRLLTSAGFSRGKIRKWIGKKWVSKGYKVVDATVRGINYRLHITRNTTDQKILTSSKFYDKEEILHLAKGLDPETLGYKGEQTTFIDVGANTGYYALSLAYLGYSKVIAIEPNPPTLEMLRFNVGCNNVGENITIVPVCIGDGNNVDFYTSAGLGTASVIKENHGSKPITVPSMPLLDIIKNNNIKSIQGLKIDVEGFEDKALMPFFESAQKSLWPRYIVIEDCHAEDWDVDIIAYLKKIGYVAEGSTRGNQLLHLHDC